MRSPFLRVSEGSPVAGSTGCVNTFTKTKSCAYTGQPQAFEGLLISVFRTHLKVKLMHCIAALDCANANKVRSIRVKVEASYSGASAAALRVKRVEFMAVPSQQLFVNWMISRGHHLSQVKTNDRNEDLLDMFGGTNNPVNTK